MRFTVSAFQGQMEWFYFSLYTYNYLIINILYIIIEH